MERMLSAVAGVVAFSCACYAELDPLDVQGMIDRAKVGETVTIPPGDWEAKPFRLKSNQTLEIAKDAVVYASTNIDDYCAVEGQRFFIGATDATNVTIRGGGVFDGRGHAFKEKKMTDGASQPQRLPVMMRFIRCRNLHLEGFTYRAGGAWGCHLCNCDGVIVRRLTCFNHSNHTNDGIDIESRNVLVEDCTFDADDDAIVFKAETDKAFAVTNALIRNCTLRSCCNAFKFGTGSYCTFRDITLENCRFERPRGTCCFAWNRYQNKWWPRLPGVTASLVGIAGMAIEMVDGGNLENVTVRNVTIDGYMTPIFVRLGNRHEPKTCKETFLRNVLIENVTGEVADSRVACSITGVPGFNVKDVMLRNVSLKFPGGGTEEDAWLPVPEKAKNYPEAFMFDFQALPAWAFYVRHAEGIRFENVTCELLNADCRPKFVFDDAEVFVDGVRRSQQGFHPRRNVACPRGLAEPRKSIAHNASGFYSIGADNFSYYADRMSDTNDSRDVTREANAHATSEVHGCEAEKVIIGNRHEDAKGVPHGWVSNPDEPLPQILTVRLDKIEDVSEVRLTFDEGPKTLVRCYALEISEDGVEWERVADVTENVRCFVVHAFARRRVGAIRVIVRKTYGDLSARVLSVSAYEMPHVGLRLKGGS